MTNESNLNFSINKYLCNVLQKLIFIKKLSLVVFTIFQLSVKLVREKLLIKSTYKSLELKQSLDLRNKTVFNTAKF